MPDEALTIRKRAALPKLTERAVDKDHYEGLEKLVAAPGSAASTERLNGVVQGAE